MQIIITSWLYALATAGILAVFGYVISIARKRNDLADITWGFYFMAIAMVIFLMHTPKFDLRLVPLGLVIIWGTRLSYHIWKRHRVTSEDRRYVAWRTAWGNGWYFYVRSFLQVFLLQGFLATLIALPLIVSLSYSGNTGIIWSVLGTSVWLVGFICESITDKQLKNFLAIPTNKGRVMQSGLWSYSRHPNYFGEIVQWWGLFVIALGVPFGAIAVIGPLVITVLIVFVSGIPLAEAGMINNPEFQVYKKKTSALIPIPRWITKNASPKTVAAILIEFGPLLLFFITFEIFNFMTSVVILVVAMVVTLFASMRLYGKVARFPLFASLVVIIFGLLTIFTKNPAFIIFKDTLYFGGFGLIILIPLLLGKLILKTLFDSIFAITDKGWKIVSIRWIVFMFLIAVSNEWARVYFTADQWVTYKFIVVIVLIFFSIWQFFLSKKERLPHASPWGLRIE
jgi:intracellular septation protein A